MGAWKKTNLKFTFVTGQDMETGKDITKSKTFSNIRHLVSDVACIDVAMTLEGLQKHDLVSVDKIDYTIIIKDTRN